MANQIVVSAGAKVRNLQDVIIGTSGVLTSLGFDVANGVPRLDVNGKILVSQLPNSVMEYKGTWNISTNTPTLVNGTGNQGDVYLVEGAAVGGTAFNFGAGPITFFNGDQAIYSGSIWQRASGATGTVTSVAITESGDSLNITGSPISTSGTINIGFNGTNLQYVNGAGNLTTFPTLMTSVGLTMPSAFTVTNSPLTGAGGTLAVTGAGTTAQYIRGDGSLATFPTIASEAQRLITEVYNSTGATLTKGTVVYINGGHGNLPTVTKAIATGDATSAQTYGVVQTDITNMNNGYVVVIGSLMDLDTQAYPNGTQLYLSSTTAGAWTDVKQYAPAHLVYVAIVTRSHPTQGVVEVRIQNGFEMDELHNVSAQTPSNNQGLFYNTSTSLWENKSIATALGYTPADDSLVVKLAGTQTITGAKTFTATLYGTDSEFSGSVLSPIFSVINGTKVVNLQSLATLNRDIYLPDASGTIALTSALANYVDLTTAQTIGGTKTFSDATKNNGGIFLQNASSNSLAGYMNLGGLTNGVKFTSGGGVSNSFTLPSATGYTFTFPNATGTIALTSDLTDFVTLSTAQTISGIKTFSSSILSSGIGFFSTIGGTNYGGIVGTPTYFQISAGGGSSILLKSDNGTNAIIINTLGKVDFGSTIGNGTYTYTLPSATGTIALVGGSGVGTVTSVAALTIGTSGTDLSSSVANSTTTPVITLNVPTASATNRGALSSADWTTFNGKQAALSGTGFVKISGTTISYDNSTYLTTSSAASTYLPLAGGTLTGPLSGTSAVFSSSVGSSLGSGGVYFSGDASPDFGFLGYNYTNVSGTESVYQNIRESWRIRFGNGGTKTMSFGIRLGSAAASSWSEYLTIFSNGNITTGTSDAGYKLDVNGTGRFSSSSTNQLTLNGGTTVATRLLVARGSDDSSQNLLLGWNSITVQRTSVTITDPQTDFSIIQQASNGSRTALYIASTGAATFSAKVSAKGGSNFGGYYMDYQSDATSRSFRVSSEHLVFADFVIQRSTTRTGTTYEDLLYFDANRAATFSSSVTATSFFESSDSRLKTLIQDNYQTKGIASITPKLYTKNGKVELGYYAQDFVGILDSAVSKGSDDMLSLSYREVLVAKVYALEQEIKELKAKMN